MRRSRSLRTAALWFCVYAALAPTAFAGQEPATQSPETAPAPQEQPATPGPGPEVDAATMLLQQYTDPLGRFGIVAPAHWGRLPSPSPDEVVFESDTGDSMRISVQPLKVDPHAFASAYVDTYLKVLAQTFTNVKFIGQRDVTLNFRVASDFVFSAEYSDAPVTCHQVVLLGGDKVLYITFAAFGRLRSQSETLFATSIQSLWVSAAFGGATTASVTDPNAPSYVLAIPEGWVDQGPGDGTSHMFRPPNARQTAAYISTRVTKLPDTEVHKTVDDGFVAAFGDTVKAQHPEDMFELRQTRKLFLGGEPAVRYDFNYVSNIGIRRALLVLCVRKGYLVGITCDAADQSYAMYDQAFEGLVAGFRFK